jgi:hypothetical protein
MADAVFWYVTAFGSCRNRCLGTSTFTTATRRNIPEHIILHSHRRENLKSYIALIGWWALQRRRNVFPVRYEMGFNIPEDGILQICVTCIHITNYVRLL